VVGLAFSPLNLRQAPRVEDASEPCNPGKRDYAGGVGQPFDAKCLWIAAPALFIPSQLLCSSYE